MSDRTLLEDAAAHASGARAQAIASGRIVPESIEAGHYMALMAEKAVALLAAQGEPDERCKTCAFREGTIPNQCADTISDAIKCVVEGEAFYCHVKLGSVCHGWFAARVASSGVADAKVPWPFSHAETDAAASIGRLPGEGK